MNIKNIWIFNAKIKEKWWLKKQKSLKLDRLILVKYA